MSKVELRSALVRAIVLEHQNANVKPFPHWGWERPISLYQLRSRRLRLAHEYAFRFDAVSPLLFGHKLPQGPHWRGVSALVAPLRG